MHGPSVIPLSVRKYRLIEALLEPYNQARMGIDQRIVAAANHFVLLYPWLASAVALVAEKGIWILPLALLIVWIWPGVNFWERSSAIFSGAISVLLAGLLSLAIGAVVNRPRPFTALPIRPFLHSLPKPAERKSPIPANGLSVWWRGFTERSAWPSTTAARDEPVPAELFAPSRKPAC